ncbi:hypothetical protein VCO01S_21660 [Vibrio comitans NBRC 102076]|uniref:Uncharacterized protein n=1 Tax=Vibrio comitans NBRC 102076 TaxID=1219078 RepID=A0A4Y3INA0_9VIBR|nr:hypothetical protein VCO01S_21660 [Vibrio comitans NBRC 102076]
MNKITKKCFKAIGLTIAFLYSSHIGSGFLEGLGLYGRESIQFLIFLACAFAYCKYDGNKLRRRVAV